MYYKYILYKYYILYYKRVPGFDRVRESKLGTTSCFDDESKPTSAAPPQGLGRARSALDSPADPQPAMSLHLQNKQACQAITLADETCCDNCSSHKAILARACARQAASSLSSHIYTIAPDPLNSPKQNRKDQHVGTSQMTYSVLCVL